MTIETTLADLYGRLRFVERMAETYRGQIAALEAGRPDEARRLAQEGPTVRIVSDDAIGEALPETEA